MAKGQKNALTGAALLAALAEAPQMLTQAEGAELVNAGFATVDTSVVEGDRAQVSITEAGRAQLAASQSAPAASAPAATGGFEIETVPMPTRTRNSGGGRGRAPLYPFDQLEIGQSFHVPKTDENPDPTAKLASSVSGARVRHSEETGETETVKVKVYQKDAEGNFVKGEDGKRIVEREEEQTRPVRRRLREFTVFTVGEDDPRGPGARVFRVALKGEDEAAQG